MEEKIEKILDNNKVKRILIGFFYNILSKERITEFFIGIFNELSEKYNNRIRDEWQTEIFKNLNIKIKSDEIEIKIKAKHQIVGEINFEKNYKIAQKDDRIYINDKYIGKEIYKNGRYEIFIEERTESEILKETGEKIKQILKDNELSIKTNGKGGFFIMCKHGTNKIYRING